MINPFFRTIRDYLTLYLPKQKCCSEHTIKSYREVLNCFVTFLNEEKGINMSAISFTIVDYAMVMEFIDYLQTLRNYSASTRNHRLIVIRSFFKYAGISDCALIDTHLQLKSIPLQKENGRIVEYLSENSLKTLLSQPNQRNPTEYRNMVMMCLMYDSAARCGEILNLRLKDLRIDTQYPTVYLFGKGKKMRIVPLMQQTVLHCQRYIDIFHPSLTRKPDDHLFYTVIHNERQQMSPDNVAYFMNKYGIMARTTCSDIPAKVHPHQLRHTRAIHLYRNGMPLYLLSEYLGHTNPETTKIYAYADSEMKRKAIQKAEDKRGNPSSPVEPIWKNDEEMLRRLCGLK